MRGLNIILRNRLRWAYVVTDVITTSVALFLYNVFRWSFVSDSVSLGYYMIMPKIIGGQLIFTLLLMGIYWLSGYYNKVEDRSRAQEFITTARSAGIGAVAIFFLAVVNDSAWRRRVVFESLFVAAALLFICVYGGRYLITRIVVRRVHERINLHEAVMIGTDAEAAALAQRINTLRKGMGLKVSAFVRLDADGEVAEGCRGCDIIGLASLGRYCMAHAVSSMILSPRFMNDGKALASFIGLAVSHNCSLFVSPDVNTIAIASQRSFNVIGEPLVCVSSPNIPESTVNFKRAMDVAGSALALVLLAPFMGLIALGIRRDSRGPVFFRQERLGYGGKPFNIIKFRSMKVDAEADGRARVTVDGDERITRFGRFLRKYRLDELPQFVNVLRGEMSLVGPRPERRVFAELIAARVPLYPLLYQVRPGITSWGMVRYGYASDVDQMVERLRYDLIYLENISISTDLKILLHTVNTVVSGRGK